MPWYFPWSESIKKRACRYLLQHYLGDFLKEKLTLDQLTVDLYNGKGTVLDVPLDVWALNEMLECMGIPLQLVDGYIGSISVAVPWTALLNDSCQIEINGLDLTLTPRIKAEPGGMYDSVSSWNSMSMTTSMQLAQECLKQESGRDSPSQSFEGLEAFAQTIESVLSRIQVSFVNTAVRLEHIPGNSKAGIGLELHIDRIDFSDTSNSEVYGDGPRQHTVYEPVAVAVKNLHVIGLALFMDEFPEHKRTRHRISQPQDTFTDPHSLTPILDESLNDFMNQERDQQLRQDSPLLPQVQIVGSCGRHHLKAKLKQNDSLLGPKVDVEYNLGAINIFLTPRQLHLLIALASVFDVSQSSSSEEPPRGKQHHTMRTMKDDDYKVVEEALQQQINSSKSTATTTTTKTPAASLQTALHSFQSGSSSLGTSSARAAALSLDYDSEEEFFSMAELSLPALSQPPSVQMDDKSEFRPSGMTGGPPPVGLAELTNVSLSSNLLATQRKVSLAEQASTVLKARTSSESSNDGMKRLQGGINRHGITTGLANLSNLSDSTDTTRIKVKGSNLIAVILHRDPLGSSTQEDATRTTDHSLTHMSEEFFKQIGRFSMQNLFDADQGCPRDELASISPYDHLRFLMSVITVEWQAQSVSGWHSSTADVIIGKLAVDESLFDMPRKRHHATLAVPYTQTKIVHFDCENESKTAGEFISAPTPAVKVKMHQVTRRKNTVVTVQSRPPVFPKSTVTMTLAPTTLEVDVTILDRLNALLRPDVFFSTAGQIQRGSARLLTSFMTASLNQQFAFNQVIDDSPVHGSESKTEIEAACSQATILLRFPIPDLRPVSDIDKRPWWRKALRQESLSFDVMEIKFKTSQNDANQPSSHDFSFKDCQGGSPATAWINLLPS